jgi:hypothetical protein
MPPYATHINFREPNTQSINHAWHVLYVWFQQFSTEYYRLTWLQCTECSHNLCGVAIYILRRISKIFSIFTSEMFIHLKTTLPRSFLALYNEYTVKIISALN